MKRDLKINFGTLDTIITQIDGYTRALEDMRQAITTIDSLIETSSGKSIDALGESRQKTLDAIQAFYNRLTDLRVVLSSYIDAMTSEIAPLARFAMTQADSNDTYWNVQQISWANIKAWGCSVNTPPNANPADVQNNLTAATNIYNTVAALTPTLDGHIDRLWALHDKVVRYENTDDAYRTKADELYWRYTDLGIRVVDVFGAFVDGVADVIVGLIAGVINIAVGLYGIAEYASMAIAYWITKPVGTPDAIVEYMTEANDTIGAVLNDPMLILEGIAQEMSDTADEKGVPYFIGSVIPDIAGIIVGAKGVDKVAKIGKVRAVDELDDVADVAGGSKPISTSLNVTNEVLESPRKGSALKPDPYHAFNDIIDNSAGLATKTDLGNGAILYQLEGALNGVEGRFEWITQGGATVHRMFVPGGAMNGVPIKK